MMATWLLETPSPENSDLDKSEDAPERAVETPILSILKDFSDGTGLPCMLVDREFGRVLAQSHAELLPYVPPRQASQLVDVTAIEVDILSDELTYFVVPVPAHEGVVITGYVFSSQNVQPPELHLAALQAHGTKQDAEQWLKCVPVCESRVLRRLLECAYREMKLRGRESELQLELDALSQQIDYTYEEISLLHRLTQNLHLSRPSEELAELSVRGLYPLIESSGVGICIENSDHSMRFLSQGRLPFDQMGFARLLARFDQHNWSKPLVKNKLQHTLLGEDFPGLKNIVIVPIGDPQHRRGWIVATNLRGGREFGTVEANLISSIATILGTHIRNIELYDEHDELLVGFVRSLVSTLDAKDPYTRGHSERVALLARCLGQQIGLETSDLEDIYMSGLLHDIGKVGVDDRILAKPGQLTEDEFRQIQQHPMIGYQILCQLRNLAQILPGVRHHHEAFNGKGYPDKLKGEGIPLMARIIAVADSYDAMVSDRPYRKGMPLERLEEIFRRGAGEQWDPRVIEAYFQTRDDFRHLCATYSPSAGNLLRDKSSSRAGINSGRALLKQ
ncbi:MAG: HD-GYP domain-containing protein [Planctomycetes bacterium]|nr:HD-GYP domain-containing protein [Planctomycetota bacterium]